MAHEEGSITLQRLLHGPELVIVHYNLGLEQDMDLAYKEDSIALQRLLHG